MVLGRLGASAFLLGLSEVNLTLLREGKPMVVELSEAGGVGQLVIVWGPTEGDIVKKLKDNKIVDASTTVLDRRGS